MLGNRMENAKAAARSKVSNTLSDALAARFKALNKERLELEREKEAEAEIVEEAPPEQEGPSVPPIEGM